MDSMEILCRKVLGQPNNVKESRIIRSNIESIQCDMVALKEAVERIEIKQPPQNSTTKTYASVVSSPSTPQSQRTLNSKTSSWLAAQRSTSVKIPYPEDRHHLRSFKNNELKACLYTILANCPTKELGKIKLSSVSQLKSGDLAIQVSSYECLETLREYRNEWTPKLGKEAALHMPTYGIIAHGVEIQTMDTKDQNKVTRKLEAENRDVIPSIKVARVSWLGKRKSNKKHASIIIEFEDPKTANLALDNGIVWESTLLYVEKYDRSCRLRHCFQCQKYGHIGTQCRNNQTCGFCSQGHRSQDCPTMDDNNTHLCINCKGKHPAWSPSCSVRKAENQKVAEAKLHRTPYHFEPPAQEKRTAPKTRGRPPLGRQASKPPSQRQNTSPRPQVESSHNTRKRARQSTASEDSDSGPATAPQAVQTQAQARAAASQLLQELYP